MAAPATPEEIHEVNVRYHDLAAQHYDSKWGIDYGELGQSQVTAKIAKALGGELGHYESGLEIGAGTGYFGLNLVLAGSIDNYAAADISPSTPRRHAPRPPSFPSRTAPSTSSSATRCSTTCRTSRSRSRSSCVSCARAA
jgi:hypothetical protein